MSNGSEIIFAFKPKAKLMIVKEENKPKRIRYKECEKSSKKQKSWPLKGFELHLQKKLERVIEVAKEKPIEELNCIKGIKADIMERVKFFIKKLKEIKEQKQKKIDSKIEKAHNVLMNRLESYGIKISQCGKCFKEFPNVVKTPCDHYICMCCYRQIHYYEDEKICFECPTCKTIDMIMIPSKWELLNSYLAFSLETTHENLTSFREQSSSNAEEYSPLTPEHTVSYQAFEEYSPASP